MSKHLRTPALRATIVAALAAAPALYAQSYLRTSHDSMMGEGMMGGMMSGMMEHCGQMMQAMNDDHAHRPNDQWRSPKPEPPAQPRE